MKNKTVELVNQWNAFEQKHPQGEIADFCRYFLEKSKNKKNAEVSQSPLPLNARLATSIVRLSRFAQFYSRRVLDGLELNNIDDFTYILTLNQLKNPKKSTLIEENITEFSTGSEIINRLRRLGFIKEYPDKEDKRSKRLELTAKGKKILDLCFERIKKSNGAGAMLLNNLAEDDKELVYQILNPLDKLHTNAYRQVKSKDITEIAKVLAQHTSS
jgi:DNA-binding MarR family transcriptional regulator